MKTLIIIDVQNDFLPGGSLAVPNGDQIIPLINKMMPEFDHVIATQDWHPKGHSSFAIWKEHCVQNTKGAELSAKLDQKKIEKRVLKGTDLNDDGYSAFLNTDLIDYLKNRHLKELYFVGLATDYCVLSSVLDALEFGFNVWVIRNGCKAIGNEDVAIEKMRSRGAKIIS